DGLEGWRVPDGLEGWRVPDGLEGWRVPDGLEGWRVPDGLEGAWVYANCAVLVGFCLGAGPGPSASLLC
ncbi:hypothetical protein ACFU6S_43345, partial [Streptomyces sp. NPDC057456]|uniref:hypothetical protein n=1 Tax=Streptomyces sp. NPDC057456 TaxID=3346139 RepID=UPI0036A8FF35